MDPPAASIVEYIQNKYPKVVYEPVKFSNRNAIGFILTDSQIIIGYINKQGNLCKLAEPINLADLTEDSLKNVVSRIPLVNGFTEKDKERLVKILNKSGQSISLEEHRKALEEVQKRIISEKEAEYKVMIDSSTNETLLIKNKYESKLNELQSEYNELTSQVESCKKKLIEEKGLVIKGIEEYKEQVGQAVKEKDYKITELQEMYNKMKEEKRVLTQRLDELLAGEESKMKKMNDNISEYESKLSQKETEIDQLRNSVKEIEEKLSESEMKAILLESMNSKCLKQIMNEKEIIIKKINEYNEKWEEWSKGVVGDVTQQKERMLYELRYIQRGIQEIVQNANVSKSEYIKLKQNAADIQMELNKTIADQLAQLNYYKEKNETLASTASSSCDSENERITQLQRELDEVRKLISANDATKIDNIIDYDNCNQTLMNFYALNNIFYRKLEIINKLDDIITKDIGYFSNLDESTKQGIKETFDRIKSEINKHIQFLDLKKYIDSPNMQYLKSKATQDKVEPDFCYNLGNILDYWNENKLDYREQDRILTNIYEDLSGAVRVYIRMKPLIGAEQKLKTVSIHTIENKKQKSIVLDCTGVEKATHKTKDIFGEFYGIFGESFGNIDVYSGLENTPIDKQNPLKVNIEELVESTESIHPGLWSTFKQVEDGYSIVVFGYGLSGSGKTFTLLGERGTPGLIHYGLANLRNVKRIQLKNLFEHYVGFVDVNFRTVRGKIHNLINRVPKIEKKTKAQESPKFTIDETDAFKRRIPQAINVDNLNVDDLFVLTDIIEKYRVEKKRIKKTPNNPTSSRSHLFFVFEIEFENKRKGYVTIVDTAGRESPVDIYKTFIDTSKASLGGVISTAGLGTIERGMKKGLDAVYTAEHIYDVLKEGIFVNESINHLTYFFNKKNYRTVDPPKQETDYNVKAVYVVPQIEESQINDKNNCLMIPILNFLDSLSTSNENQFKPTKFIMMCMVRQEEKYCDQIHETLEFAAGVKSS